MLHHVEKYMPRFIILLLEGKHTLQYPLISVGKTSSKFSTPHSRKKSSITEDGEPIVMLHIKLIFFTNPTACPSGVSAGHTMPVVCFIYFFYDLSCIRIGIIDASFCCGCFETSSYVCSLGRCIKERMVKYKSLQKLEDNNVDKAADEYYV